MGNKNAKGYVKVKADGKDWTVVCDFNALCDFEEETGENAMDFLDRLSPADDTAGSKVSASQMRILFWCALKQHHPDATKAQAGQVMTAAPDALFRALDAALPEASDDGGAGEPAPGEG